MFATTIRFQLPADTDWERLRQQAVRSAFDVFRGVPGLRAKAFVFSPERSEFGGNYVWDTQDDAEAYLRSEGWRATVSRLGEPTIERSEICAYVECGDLVFPPDYDARRPAPRGASAPSSAPSP
jgi:hypothetical protein